MRSLLVYFGDHLSEDVAMMQEDAMSVAQINNSLKLDLIYSAGAIAFISAGKFLVPILKRDDACPAETGEIMVRFGNRWLEARPDQIKFCRRH
jgi:hypothetical protein